MSTFKKCSVVMLPTNKKARIHQHPEGMMYQSVDDFIQASQAYKSFHLYILSDDEIKEGDWYISKNTGIPLQATEDHIKKFIDDKKIIATTDKSLVIEGKASSGDIVWRHPLPQPSQSFIEVFVREYNKGNIITHVMVEYDEYVDIPREHLLTGSDVEKECMKHPYWKPKVNLKDNTITIKKVKDSWSREEVTQLCWEAFIDFKCVDGKIKPSDAEKLLEPFNKWIQDRI